MHGVVWGEAWSCLLGACAIGLGAAIIVRLLRGSWRTAVISGAAIAVVLILYILWFFRDPDRSPPTDPDAVVAGADGRIARITHIPREAFCRLIRTRLGESALAKLGRLAESDTVRISIFLSLWDVHVNRAPIGGTAHFLGYVPGKRFFTFQEKSSSENQHNAIFIRNDRTCCLYNQIVGPVARRVVYWPPHDRPTAVTLGQRVGMMKFGSRLDMYFPEDDMALSVKEGDRVFAGITVIGRLKTKTP